MTLVLVQHYSAAAPRHPSRLSPIMPTCLSQHLADSSILEQVLAVQTGRRGCNTAAARSHKGTAQPNTTPQGSIFRANRPTQHSFCLKQPEHCLKHAAAN